MNLLFNWDARKGSYIEDVSKVAGSVTLGTGGFKRTEKGTAFYNRQSFINFGNLSAINTIGTGDFSIEFWCRKESLTQGVAGVFDKGRFTDTTHFALYFTTTALRVGIVSAQLFANAITAADINQWRHFIVTRTGNSYKLYKDNVYHSEVTHPDSLNWGNAENVYVGARTGSAPQWFDGFMGGVRIYKKALNVSERNRLYQSYLQLQITEKPVRGFELVKPTDLSYLKDDKLGTNLTDNYDFMSWTSTGTAFVSKTSNSFTTNNAGGGVSLTSLLTIGKKYRMTIRGTTTSGYTVTNTAVSPTYATFGVGDFNSTIDFTATTAVSLYLRNTAAGTTTITHLSFQEVTGLVAAYNMKPSGSTLVDISGNGQNLLAAGSPISTKDGTYFNGESCFYKTGSITASSALLRFRISSASESVFIGGFESDGRCLIIQLGKIQMSKTSLKTSTAWSDGNWHTLYASLSGTYYVDGVLQPTEAATSLRGSGSLVVGARISGTYSLFHTGDLGDIRLYNRALTEQEIKDYHNSFITPVILEDWSGSAVSDVI